MTNSGKQGVAIAPIAAREQEAPAANESVGTSICPTCRRVTLPGADICEACGTWLLPTRCMFCAAEVKRDDTYCGACGNPTAGITCPRCARRSIFDFCKYCAIPLSAVAQDMARALVQDPEQRELAGLLIEFQDPKVAAPAGHSDGDDSLARMKAMRAAISGSQPSAPAAAPRRPLFSDAQKMQIGRLADDIRVEEERRRLEEEQRRQEEERRRQEAERQRLEEAERLAALKQEINQRLNRLKGKTFASNQEARRFFMSLIASLPKEIAVDAIAATLVWRCNAYDCEHASPADCADPSRGGVWLLR